MWFLNVLDRVLPVGIPGYEQKLSDLPTGGKLWFLVDENHQINRLSYECLLRSVGRLGYEAFKSDQAAHRIIGVHSRHPAGVTRVPRLQQSVGLCATYFTDYNPRRLRLDGTTVREDLRRLLYGA